MKAQELATATTIRRAWGESESSSALARAIGAINTATAAVGMTWAENAVIRNRPAISAVVP